MDGIQFVSTVSKMWRQCLKLGLQTKDGRRLETILGLGFSASLRASSFLSHCHRHAASKHVAYAYSRIVYNLSGVHSKARVHHRNTCVDQDHQRMALCAYDMPRKRPPFPTK